MTKEEHDILIENNRLLKYILQMLTNSENNDFTTNVLANIIADKIMCK